MPCDLTNPQEGHITGTIVYIVNVCFGKKSGIPELKYLSHSTEDCIGMHTRRTIKDGMGGPMVNRNNYMQQYKKSENKWKKDLKAFKK